MEIFIPLLILAVVVVAVVGIYEYNHNAKVKTVVDGFVEHAKVAAASAASGATTPAAAVEIAPAVLMHPAVTQGLVTAATAAILPTAALDLIAAGAQAPGVQFVVPPGCSAFGPTAKPIGYSDGKGQNHYFLPDGSVTDTAPA